MIYARRLFLYSNGNVPSMPIAVWRFISLTEDIENLIVVLILGSAIKHLGITTCHPLCLYIPSDLLPGCGGNRLLAVSVG